MSKIKKLPIGLEMYSVREAYAADADGTLAALRDMGYDGVEFYGGEGNNLPAEAANELLAKHGLTCFGYQPDWPWVQEDTFERTLRFSEAMNNRRIGIAAAPADVISTREGLESVIALLNKLNDTAQKSGFELGYHAHRTDFVVVDGKTAWDHIFENTPDSFRMVLDTGNALAGGAWSVPLLEKFPRRSPWIHIKPFSLKDQGATMIGEDDFDWPELLTACVELGGAEILDIEYSNNARYQPMEASRLCIERLRGYME